MPQVAAAIAATFTAISGAISGAVAAVSAFAAASAINAFIVNTALSIGLSLLARALSPKPKIRQAGIQTDVTTTGGTVPQKFIIGTYATAGHLVAPPYSHGASGETPNAYLNYIIQISDFPGVALSRVIVNDDYSALDTTADPDYGDPLLKFRVSATDHAWIKFYDGTQTAADAMLVAKYASHPDRPWNSTAIGTDTAYAVMTFLYNRELFNNLPSVRFEITGIPLYDPRADSTAGGSGSQRFNDQSTWAFSDNPAVMIYNIMRGIELPDGSIYGGEMTADDLPYSNWAAAMNACDVLIGSRKTYRAGFEVDVSASPSDVIDELLKVCHGQVSEYGGIFRIRVGAPAASVLSITDDIIVITDPQEFLPFPGLEQTYNAITGTYPEPVSLYNPREAPPIYNATWETEDGGRRLPIEMTFPACPYIQQVEQLMNGYIEDNRRFRTHRIVLPPSAAILEPLDTISWTSARNGYTTKLFEVIELVDRPMSLLQEIYVRERDSADYNWSSGQDPATPASDTGLTAPAAQLVEGFTATALTLKDGLGLDRRPAIRAAWTGTSALDAEFVQIEIRLKVSAAVIFYGVFSAREGFAVVSDGILPSTVYEVRGRYVMDRPSDWSSWIEVTTDAVYISDEDFDGGIRQLFEDAGLSAPEIVSTLPNTGNFQGRLVFLTTDNKLYRWTGSVWTTAVPTVDLTGTISEAQIAANAVTTTKIANAAVEEAKLATAAATEAKIATSAITETKISSNAVTSAKINAGAVIAGKIAAGAVQAGNIAAGAIVANDIAAGTITGDKIAANTLTASNIVSGTITATQIASNTITASNIAGNTITGDKIVANTITGGLLATSGIITSAAQINDALITTAKIGNAQITSAKFSGTIQSDNYVAGTSGWKITRDTGTAEFQNATIRGTLNATDITAGTISADRLPGLAVANSTSISGTIAKDATATYTVSFSGVKSGTKLMVIMQLGGRSSADSPYVEVAATGTSVTLDYTTTNEGWLLEGASGIEEPQTYVSTGTTTSTSGTVGFNVIHRGASGGTATVQGVVAALVMEA